MSTVLVLAGVALLALPGAATSTARHLRPGEWRRFNRAAIHLGLVVVQLGLLLAATPTLLAAAGVHSVADACHHLLGPALLGGAVVGWASLAMGVALLAVDRGVRRRARQLQRAARIEGWLGEHRRLPGATLVVLTTDAVVAYAAPGSPSQVVVSRRLVDALGQDELDADVRHELAHLRNRHHRDLVLAAVVDAALGWLPGARASTRALRLSVERSADEEAADRPGARDATRRALLKTTETMLGPVPAFTAASTLQARLDALATPPADPTLGQRVAAFAPLAALAAVVTAGVTGTSVSAHHSVVHLLGLCPF